MMYKVDAMFDSFCKAATALRVSILFLALLCAQGFPSAAPAWAEPESGLTLDFKDADIHALIKYISEATGRNFSPSHGQGKGDRLFPGQDFPG